MHDFESNLLIKIKRLTMKQKKLTAELKRELLEDKCHMKE